MWNLWLSFALLWVSACSNIEWDGSKVTLYSVHVCEPNYSHIIRYSEFQFIWIAHEDLFCAPQDEVLPNLFLLYLSLFVFLSLSLTLPLSFCPWHSLAVLYLLSCLTFALCLALPWLLGTDGLMLDDFVSTVAPV